MKLYLDREFRCHMEKPEDFLCEVETDFFEGKCRTFIEGYRIVPMGYHWTRSDGTVFHGEMVAPYKPYVELAAAQTQYEAMLSDMNNAYAEGVSSA